MTVRRDTLDTNGADPLANGADPLANGAGPLANGARSNGARAAHGDGVDLERATASAQDSETAATVRRVRALRHLSSHVLVPVAGTIAALALADDPARAAVLAFIAFFCASLLLPARKPWASLMPLMRSPLHAVAPLLGVGALAMIQALTGHPGLTWPEMLLVLALTTVAGAVPYVITPHSWSPDRQIRTAVIGSPRSVATLVRELRNARVPDYLVVGRIDVGGETAESDWRVPTLGTLDELSALVERHRIDLLLMTGEAPRFQVFEEIASSCLHLPVRLWELSAFCEDVFGHVAVAEINASWFQYIIHPKYRPGAPASKRILDVVVAAAALLIFLPILAVVALLIRRDGGPVLFRQERIGEGGRPITVYKLRTMRVGSDRDGVRWSPARDPRVTPLGSLLRRMHLDELPQLFNVLRGDMSLVGPRPEQPGFVERLEEVLPFYTRRHLLKPGITGWAQVRCGYADSEAASAWKLSHDLYYLKHRSMSFDLALLGETLRTLVADRQYSSKGTRAFVNVGEQEPLVGEPELERTAAA